MHCLLEGKSSCAHPQVDTLRHSIHRVIGEGSNVTIYGVCL